jgi:preprotein translocase subunit SecA
MSELGAVALNPLAPYVERKAPEDGALERFSAGVAWRVSDPFWPKARHFASIVAAVENAGRGLADASDARLGELAAECGMVLRREGFGPPAVASAFALVREAVRRCVGIRLFPVQLMGGYIMLSGHIAEMATGEGKTLTATLPAATAALAGLPVHVVTVNDYLVERDAALTTPIYRLLGLSAAPVLNGMKPDARRVAYARDITYCNNKELVFDYLRDRIALGAGGSRAQLRLERLYGNDPRTAKLVLRGLAFAVVDEADSALVDEARTPLIISGIGDGGYEKRIYQDALVLARELKGERDYEIQAWQHGVRLTAAGKAHLADAGTSLGGVWAARRSREELVTKALSALHLYARDKHYLVQDGKVQIVDEYTGRVMPDRSWEGGLHQLIETKEGVDITGKRETVARLTYQRFFRRYLRLSGMTGTAREVAAEIWNVYRLRVVTVPTHRPVQRVQLPPQVHDTAEQKWRAIVARIGELHRDGRPVLVGTRSVAASEKLGRLLDAAQLPYRILNARQDSAEADIVAGAGQPGRITVATNMAGRGTDIQLAQSVIAAGGLHVILTERHDARRIDRQLFGRCARQGDPGSCQAIVSLEDELVASFNKRLPWLRPLLAGRGEAFKQLTVAAAQRLAEHTHAGVRNDTLKLDEKLDTMLAFSGRVE